MSRRVGALLGAVAVACATSGCVSIPDSSGVSTANEVGFADQTAEITNVPRGPTPGADPESIVSGFYAAMLAYPPRPDIVSDFLTPKAAGVWDPSKRVTVYDQPTLSSSGNKVTVTTQTSGSLNARGSWRSARPNQVSDQQLRLRLVEGEWRIAEPPKGLLVNKDFFNRHYRAFSLYFFDPSRTSLAPDPVYLPVGDTTATALVKDLLLGPTRGLRLAVYSPIPADTKLEVSVSVSSSGLTVVPLSEDVLDLGDDDTQLFAAQLAWTLRQVEGVDRVAISVGGGDLDIPNVGTTFSAANSFAGYDPAGLSGERGLFALNGAGRLVSVTPTSASPVAGPIGVVEGGTSAAVEPSGQLAAVVDHHGHQVVVGGLPSAPEGGRETWYQGGTHLLRPSWDARRVLWLVDQTPRGQQIFAIHHGEKNPPPVRSKITGDIVTFSVSRDGVRFAAVVKAEDGSASLQVATIVRVQGEQPRLVKPEVITNASVQLRELDDIAWSSPTSLAVLGRGAGSKQAYNVAIDGSAIQPAGGFLPVVPESIASGPTTDAPIAIGTAGGEVWVQQPDLQWTRMATGPKLFAPLYAG
jgi:hypothetical protein